MKPLILAKKIWDYASTLTGTKEKDPHYTSNPLRNYPGILSMFAGIQAAAAADDKEWIAEVNSYLAKYPERFNDPDVFFNGSFDNYRVGGLGKGWAVMKGYFDENKELIKEYADLTVNAPRSFDGIIRYNISLNDFLYKVNESDEKRWIYLRAVMDFVFLTKIPPRGM